MTTQRNDSLTTWTVEMLPKQEHDLSKIQYVFIEASEPIGALSKALEENPDLKAVGCYQSNESWFIRKPYRDKEMTRLQRVPAKTKVKRQFANDLKNCNLRSLKAYLSVTILPLLYKYLNFKHGTKAEMTLANQTKCLKITIRLFW